MVYLQQPLCFFNGGTKIEWSNWAMKRGLMFINMWILCDQEGIGFLKMCNQKRIGGKFEIKTVV